MNLDDLNFEVSETIKQLIPTHKLEALVEAFKKIDTNQDGKIEINEFLDFALTEKKVQLTRLFEYADSDKDGSVAFEEFVAAKEPNFQILRKFRELDLNQDGMLSIEECFNIADKLDLPLSAEQVKSLIQSVDQDGDGKITYYEYLGAIAHIGFQ